MRILTLNYEYPPLGGGGGVAHSLIAEELARAHHVTVVTSHREGLPRRERRGGVEIHRVPVVARRSDHVASLPSMLAFPPSALWHVGRRLGSASWDVVHGHFAVPTGPASVPVARLLDLPHVLSVYGGDVYDPSKRLSPHRWWPTRRVVEAVLDGADAVVAESTDTRDNVFRHYAYEGEVDIIPLGVRKPEIPGASREELGLPRDALVLVTVGRLIERKGLDELIRVVAGLKELDAHLVVVGDGPLRAPLRRLSERLGVGGRVHFRGFVPEEEKWQVLECSDLYVSTTVHEGFGLVYLEAMLAGLPVITYSRGGQTDFLEDGVTGALVDVGDASALADAVRSAASEQAERRRIGRRNRERARAYTARECARAYERLFRRLVDGGRDEPERAARNGREAGVRRP